jgi:ERCC4-type nuclease
MFVKIDMRENELIKKMEYLIQTQDNFKEIKIQTENLPIGDIIVTDGEKDVLIIERKTLNDLSASIKDGRYEEQSYRLNGLPHHNHNIVYLIEGDINNTNSILFKQRLDRSTLYSALFSIAFYKGFSLMRSYDLSETAFILCNMIYKLSKSKNREFFYTDHLLDEREKEEKTYCEVIKKVKKENITKENIGQIMLCQIPGISSQSAKAILHKFGSLPQLIKDINEDSNCLNDICMIDSKNKSRKINKTCIQNILTFLKN